MSPAEESVAFYHEIGLAITQWAHVEMALARVTAYHFEPKHGGLSIDGFFSIENFRAKLSFANSILETSITDGAQIVEWGKLHSRLEKSSKSRNELAHQRAIVYPDSKPGRRYALVPWFVEDPKMKSKSGKQIPPPGSLCIRDINGVRLNFLALANALTNFEYRLDGLQGPFRESSEQAGGPLEIDDLRRRIHEVLGHPLKPSRKKP